jgi:CheY-like chemotaxis protein
MDVEKFSQSAKGFTKSPLGIIALFIVLVYGFASIVVSFGNNLSSYVAPLVYFLVLFPVIVFGGFLWLVSRHHNKLYGPSDFQDETNFIKIQMATVASLAAATAKQPTDKNDFVNTQSQLNEIVEVVSRTTNKGIRKWSNKILWVDDRPENNVYERQAFESQGIIFNLALSTNEAIEMLMKNKYAAIISDMGRKEGPQEGYVLLDYIRRSGDTTPFFIYAGSNTSEHKKMAKEKGAQGSTNRAQDLFELVISAIKR